MDRLSIVGVALTLAGCLALCCGDETGATQQPPGRVVAVAARESRVESAAEFCDVEGGSGPKLTLPRLDTPYALPQGRVTWINVWATWCKPCIAELPLIIEWAERMRQEGRAIDQVFLSADEDRTALGTFLAAHPLLNKTLRLKDPEALAPWMARLGLDQGAGLPLHIFADRQGLIRCVRAAALSDNHYPIVSKLLGQQ